MIENLKREASKEVLFSFTNHSSTNCFLPANLAQTYKCCICSIDNFASRIPLTPLKTNLCHHFYCPLCIENWRSAELVNSGSCPVSSCRKSFEDVDLHAPAGLVKCIHAGLSVHCAFINNGCEKIISLGDYSSHVASCIRSRRRGHPPKRLIGTLARSDQKKKRVDSLREDFLNLCANNQEDPDDALCALLHSLHTGSRFLQEQIRGIWNRVMGLEASEEQAEETDNNNEAAEKIKLGRKGLLYKGELLLSANDYKKAIRFQKHLFGTKLPDYDLVQMATAAALPSNSNYHLVSDKDLKSMLKNYKEPERILRNAPTEPAPTDIKIERKKSLFHHSVDNCDTMDPCSIQLNFLDSSFSLIMVTGRVLYNILNLRQLNNFDGEAVVTITMFRDGTDKIEIMNTVSDRLLPVAGWKTSIAITRITEKSSGKLIFMRSDPCSPYNIQPVCAAFMDENDIGSLVAMSTPFEEEAEVLRNSKMVVTALGGLQKTFSFVVRSVPDKKVGTKDVGCTIAGSKFICQKGPATSESAKKSPQTCVPDKTLQNSKFWAFLWLWNPEKLDASDLYTMSTGMYNFPITSAEPPDRPVDVLHQTKINFWEKIKKLVVNLMVFAENPELKKTWEMRGFSQEFKNQERKLNSHLSVKLRIPPKMTQNPGTDANKALDPVNRNELLHFLSVDSDDRKNLKGAMEIFDVARVMFNYIPKLDEAGHLVTEEPKEDEFLKVIKNFHEKFYGSFPWAACSSGQHDICDHIGEHIGSICESSAQGVESQHHLWRYFLTNNSFKGDPQRRLDDSLESQYILTDDEIVAELKVLPTEVHRCSNCHQAGHNVTTCREPCGKCGSYLHKINGCQTAVFSSDMVLHSTF